MSKSEMKRKVTLRFDYEAELTKAKEQIEKQSELLKDCYATLDQLRTNYLSINSIEYKGVNELIERITIQSLKAKS